MQIRRLWLPPSVCLMRQGCVTADISLLAGKFVLPFKVTLFKPVLYVFSGRHTAGFCKLFCKCIDVAVSGKPGSFFNGQAWFQHHHGLPYFLLCAVAGRRFSGIGFKRFSKAFIAHVKTFGHWLQRNFSFKISGEALTGLLHGRIDVLVHMNRQSFTCLLYTSRCV